MSNFRWPDLAAYSAELTSAVESAIKDNITIEDLNESDRWRDKETLIETLEAITEDTCVYNSTQREIMVHTDNEDAVFDTESEISVKSWDEVVRQGAYYAYRADLFDYLSRVGDDDIARILSVVQCEECGEWRPLRESVCPGCADDSGEDEENEEGGGD